MPPAEDAARQTKYKLAATFCIDADDFEAVPRGQLKQTYAARKERLFAAYKLPTPRVTRIQAFFGVDTPPQLTCEWIDSQEHALEATREVIERLAQTERTMIEKNYRLSLNEVSEVMTDSALREQSRPQQATSSSTRFDPVPRDSRPAKSPPVGGIPR